MIIMMDDNDYVDHSVPRSGSGSEIFDRLPDSGLTKRFPGDFRLRYFPEILPKICTTVTQKFLDILLTWPKNSVHVWILPGLHGDELDSPGSEDSDVYSQIDSLDRHPVRSSTWNIMIINHDRDNEDNLKFIVRLTTSIGIQYNHYHRRHHSRW